MHWFFLDLEAVAAAGAPLHKLPLGFTGESPTVSDGLNEDLAREVERRNSGNAAHFPFKMNNEIQTEVREKESVIESVVITNPSMYLDSMF